MTRLCPVLWLFLLLAGSASGKGAKPVLVLGDGAQEAVAWGEDILQPEGIEINESQTWLPPKSWGNYSIVLILGKTLGPLDEKSSDDIQKYLSEGGFVIAVGTSLHFLVSPPDSSFSSEFPDYALGWIGAKRCFYLNNGWIEYAPEVKSWPWNTEIPFQTGAYGKDPYGLMDLVGADVVVGNSDKAVIAVTKCGTGEFIFVGQFLSHLTEQESYIKAMRQAVGSMARIARLPGQK